MDKAAVSLLNFDSGIREEVLKVLNGTVDVLTTISAMVDPYTASHQKRVADLSCYIAEKLNLPKIQVEGIKVAALLHDIGKVAVPNHILSKYGSISEHEFDIIKTHPQKGYKILNKLKFPWPVDKIVLQHHERIDGSGYPVGLLGDDILLEAKIIAVADVVEAISSHRPYRNAKGTDQAIAEISENKGSLYDEAISNICIRAFFEDRFDFSD